MACPVGVREGTCPGQGPGPADLSRELQPPFCPASSSFWGSPGGCGTGVVEWPLPPSWDLVAGRGDPRGGPRMWRSPAVLGLPTLPPWGPAVGGLSWPGGPGTALLGAGRPEPHGRCPSGSYFFFFVFKKKTVKTSWTFASGFPQGIFDSDWKRLLPIEQLLGLLFKLCLSGPFPWFLGYPQGANSRQGSWVARGAPTRSRGPGLPWGAD